MNLQMKRPPDPTGRPLPKGFQHHIDSKSDDTKSGPYFQVGELPIRAGAIGCLRKDFKEQRCLTLLLECIGLALAKGVISEAEAIRRRDALLSVGSDCNDPYVESFCSLAEEKREAWLKQKRRFQPQGGRT